MLAVLAVIVIRENKGSSTSAFCHHRPKGQLLPLYSRSHGEKDLSLSSLESERPDRDDTGALLSRWLGWLVEKRTSTAIWLTPKPIIVPVTPPSYYQRRFSLLLWPNGFAVDDARSNQIQPLVVVVIKAVRDHDLFSYRPLSYNDVHHQKPWPRLPHRRNNRRRVQVSLVYIRWDQWTLISQTLASSPPWMTLASLQQEQEQQEVRRIESNTATIKCPSNSNILLLNLITISSLINSITTGLHRLSVALPQRPELETLPAMRRSIRHSHFQLLMPARRIH